MTRVVSCTIRIRSPGRIPQACQLPAQFILFTGKWLQYKEIRTRSKEFIHQVVRGTPTYLSLYPTSPQLTDGLSSKARIDFQEVPK